MTEPGQFRRRPNVLIVEQGEGLWGAQRYLLRLAPLLEARGFHQILAAPSNRATAVAWRDAGGATIDLPVPERRSMRNAAGRFSPFLIVRELLRTAHNALRLARVVRDYEIDILHANSHWSHLECAIAGILTRRPVVLHLHEENLPGVARRLRAASVRLATTTVAVSQAVADNLSEQTRKRVEVVRNGVDAQALSPGPADPQIRAEMAADPTAPLVLVMCRLDPTKGVDQVIRAVAALPAELSNTQIAIAGSGSLAPEYAHQLYALGAELLGDRVRFLGPRDDIAALLRSADVFALASSLEGLPLGVLEAQACCCPVVAYPAAGVPEVVHDGLTGLIARQGDVGHLTEQLGRLLSDPELRTTLATGAREQLVESFTIELQADRLAAVLGRLAPNHAPRPAHS